MKIRRSTLGRWLVVPALLLLGLGASSLLGQVKDEAHIFGADAVRQADDVAKEIQTKWKKQVMTETFAAVPASEADNQKNKSADEFFEQWAVGQAEAQKINGVYILICMSPKHLEVVVGNNTGKRAFTPDDRKALIGVLRQHLHADENDAALVDGVQFVHDRMAQNLASRAEANSERDQQWLPTGRAGSGNAGGGSAPSPNVYNAPARTAAAGTHWGGLICLGVGAVVLFMIVRGIFGAGRSGFGGGSYAPGYNQPPMTGGPYVGGGGPNMGGGGGGFGRGLLGGVLGGMLGGWGYDRFVRGDQGATNYQPGDQGGNAGGASFGSNDSGPDTSYTGSGSDFSDSGGGSGGGDFGGGGGGDSGSSGSDF